MIKNTSYNVRPDKHTSAEVSSLRPEESVIIYDTNEKVNKFWNGTEASCIFQMYNMTSANIVNDVP